ncbi:hypothetical protein U1Q18_008105 [Sarracenia purpurea var. burkii]
MESPAPHVTKRPKPPARRRNSIATSVVVPAKVSLPTKPYHTISFPNGTTAAAAAAAAAASSTSSSSSLSQSFQPVDFELIAIKPLSYTSLKDLLPSTGVQSPTAPAPACGQTGYEISIRNRLVKQAAWAYLQPMSTSPESSGGHFLSRLWARISSALVTNPVANFLRFIARATTRAFDRFLRAVRVPSSR